MRLRRSRPLGWLFLLTLICQFLITVPRASALSGIYHNPYGNDELYATEQTERVPRDPMAGDTVYLNATTWPIEMGQSVWITWTKNGVNQTPIGAAWQYNSGNNSYWRITMGSFSRGDHIVYTIHADVNGSGQISTGPFSFRVTSWSHVTNVSSYTNNGTSVDITTGDSEGSFTPKVRIAFPTTDSFRLQLAPTGTGLNISGINSYSVANTSSTLTLSTTDLVLKVNKTPFRLAVYKGDGTTLITQQYDSTIFRNLGWASDGSTTVTKIEDHYLSPLGERFEGFGERYDYLNQRGHDVHNYVYNQYRDQGSTHRTYLSVPFFINSAGYGIYIPSTRYSIFNIGTYLNDMVGFTTDTGGALNSTFDYYFFTGTPKQIIDRYTSVTSRPQLPPKWAFGLWMSANEWNTQSEVLAEIANTNTYSIPHTVLVLEQWSDEATFYIWHGSTYTAKPGNQAHSYSDFTFPSGAAWSDPQSMVSTAHSNGIRVILWQIPVFKENFDTNPSTAPQQHLNDKSYAQSQGYVVDNGSGSPYRVPSGQWFGDSMVPDFTNSAATAWWMSKRAYLFDDIGIDGFKTDGSEAIFGRNVSFYDGRKGDEMHNAYPNSYTDAYNSYVASKTGGNGVIFSRAGTSGAQGTSIYWAGDQNSSFEAFQEAVRAGLSAGQSGIPYWAWDMAGFTGDFPSAELYLRSAAMATFSPIMQYHSEKANPSISEARTPWNVQARTGNTDVVPIFRMFANVRMNLLPYIYTEAKRSSETGVPMMRAMSIEFPDDPDAVVQDQQYMFGDQLLVAPVTTASATTRNVYIPAGEWYDFWNGGRFTGPGTKSYGVGSLASIPVYARPGAIIPLNLNADYELGGNISNNVDTYTNLTFRIYPHEQASYDYFDDAVGVDRTITSDTDWLNQTITVGVPAITTTTTLQVIASKPTSVTRNGSPLTSYSTLAGLKSASEGWYWDPALQATLVKLPASGSARTVVLNGVNKAAYEAEFATGVGTATNTDHPGYTGTGFVDNFESLGDGVTFDINADATGDYTLRFRYANATGSTATRTITIDGVNAGTISLPSLANWDTWGTATLSASLGQGTHTIRIGYDTGNAQAINLDNLELELTSISSAERFKYTSGNNYLIVEVLDDDLFHFELSALGPGPSTSEPIATTPQVAKTDYDGPSVLVQVGNTLETSEMRAEIDSSTLCVEMYDTTTTPDTLLHEICPYNLSNAWKGLSISKESIEHAYGLGQQFMMGGSADGDWVGRTRTAGDDYGNAMVYDTDNGPVGNLQIPVLFAVGPNNINYGLFYDNIYKQTWTLTGDPWTVESWGDQLRWYVMGGPDLPDLRADYLELTGRPPVPPKQALGLWVSEYSYDNWDEIDDRLDDLRASEFPVDGFVLDLKWFGGVTQGSDNTRMGTLDWDNTNFPNHATAISDYADDGLGIILIEESYIGKNLSEHSDMASRGYLVREGCSTCDPVYLTGNDWWGRGGMIDWTQDDAGDYWHDTKRQALIEDGVLGHWLDLGEPEMYDSGDWVAGVLPGKHNHADYHNIYNLKWLESVARGYNRNGVQQRPFMLSRSGAAGIQRFGTAVWSADIGSKLTALAAQQNAQMHMSMSGIDYYGSDVGGFRREMLDSDLDELYTQWYANSMWFDIPVRPHTDNVCNCNETAPDQIGHVASNLANTRQRYELTPYYYSLAHRAYLYGEPIVPPLVFYYQNDPNVREMGHEKLIGRDILVGIVAGEGERQRNMYLPAGDWIDYATNTRYTSTGQWFNNLPLYVNGVFRLPTFVRAGAILPKMYVDDKTMNTLGQRSDSSTRDELIARVYADSTASSFTLYEDDGSSIAYQSGAVRTTTISQQLSGGNATVTIGASSGTYAGAPSSRANVVELVTDNTQASAVTLNGSPLTQYTTKAAFDAASSGWYNAGGNLVIAKSSSLSVGSAKTFVFTLGQMPVSATFTCSNGTTVPGQSVYVVGNVPQLGNWSPASAVKLTPSAYPTWTGTISNLPPNTTIEWKCIKRNDSNYPDTADQWQGGSNNSFSTPGSGSAGTTSGGF